MSVLLFKIFIPLIFHRLFIVQKHVAQICYYITFADWQTFFQMSIFNSKTHNLQTWKYDVTSSKEYLTFPLVEY